MNAKIETIINSIQIEMDAEHGKAEVYARTRNYSLAAEHEANAKGYALAILKLKKAFK